MNDQTAEEPISRSNETYNESDLWPQAIGGGCLAFGFIEGLESALLAGACIVGCALLMACIQQCICWLREHK